MSDDPGRSSTREDDIFEEAISVRVCIRVSLPGFSLCLFLEWKRLRYKGTGPRTDATKRCTFAFHEVPRMEKEIVHACEGEREGEGGRLLREQRGKWQRRVDDAGARIRGTRRGREGGR